MINRLIDRPIKGIPHKILLVSHSNPGDVILTMPCYRRLSSCFPDAQIDMVIGQESDSLIRAFHLRGEIILAPTNKSFRSRKTFFFRICKSRYDFIVDLRKSYFGLAARYGSGIFSERNKTLHRRDANLAHLIHLGVKQQDKEIELPTLYATKNPARHLICIAPGSKSDLKRYPTNLYAILADKIIALGNQVLWVGSKQDQVIIEKIQSQMSCPSDSMAGTSLWIDFKNVLLGCDLLITNDSAPLHLADDIGCPVLALFGPTNPNLYGPQRLYSKALSAALPCQPCGKAQCIKVQRDCLESISVDVVYKEACQILHRHTEPVNRDPSDHRAKKILFIRLDRIGDVLLSLPAIAHVRHKNPSAQISMMVRDHAIPILERCPMIDHAIAYEYKGRGAPHKFPFGYLKLIQRLRCMEFDEIIVLHPTFRAHLLTFLIGSAKRTGFDAHSCFLLTHRIADIRKYGLFHESECVNRLTGIRWNEKIINHDMLQLHTRDIEDATHLLKSHFKNLNQSFYIFHAGASAPSKKWHLKYFAEVAIHIQNHLMSRVILVGGSQDTALNAQLQEMIGGGCVDLTSQTSLPVLGALMQHSQGVLTNDSGPAHLANAVRARVLSIFGRNEPGLGPRRWRPLGKRNAFIWSDFGCHSCLSDDCPIEFACLNTLSPKRVLEKLLITVKPSS